MATSETTAEVSASDRDEPSAEAEADGGDSPDERRAGRDDRRLDRRLAVVATVAAVAPILVAGVRAALRGWYPVGDDSYSAARAWDVFSTKPPLMATWSSASIYTGLDINHPGPLQFDLLAIPVRLFGHGAGTAIGMALTNALAIVAIAWLASRRLGPGATAWAMGFAALLCWSMGSEMLYEPWSQFAPLLPFAAFLVAAWCAAAGDLVALPVMVAAGTYSFQTHLSYAVLVPGLAAFAVAAVILHAWAGWPAAKRPTLKWAGITVVTTLVLWAQPLAEQLAHGRDGNVVNLARSSRADLPMPTAAMSMRAFGGTVAVPPFWLPPSYGSPSFGFDDFGLPLWLTSGAIVALVGLLVVLGGRAYGRGSVPIAAGCATALVALSLGFVSTLRMPIYFGLITPTYARFFWPLGMVVWLALILAVFDEVRAHGWRLGRLAFAGTGLAVVAGVAAMPTVDHGAVAPPWTIEALDALDDDIVAAAEDAGSVLVVLEDGEANLHMGPTVFTLLQEAGVPFYVDNPALVRQLGEHRRWEPGKAEATLLVRAGNFAPLVPEGGRAVAAWDGPKETQVTVYLIAAPR